MADSVRPEPKEGKTAIFASEAESGSFLSEYIVLDSRHKEDGRGGITAWNKSIRKKDHCLLVVMIQVDPNGRRTVKEKAIEDLAFWFNRSEETIRKELEPHKLSKQEVETILRSMNQCRIKPAGQTT